MSFFLAVLSKFSDCLLILAAHLESPPIFLPDPSEHDDVGLGKRTQDAEVLWFPLCAHEILVFDAIDQSDIRHAGVWFERGFDVLCFDTAHPKVRDNQRLVWNQPL